MITKIKHLLLKGLLISYKMDRRSFGVLLDKTYR